MQAPSDVSRLHCLADAAILARDDMIPDMSCTLSSRITLPPPKPTSGLPTVAGISSPNTAYWPSPRMSPIDPDTRVNPPSSLPPLSALVSEAMITETPSTSPSPIALVPLAEMSSSNAGDMASDTTPISPAGYLPSPHLSPTMKAADVDLSQDTTCGNEQPSNAMVMPQSSSKPKKSSNDASVPRRRRRPPFSYASLIAQAILSSPERRLTLRGIYQWLMEQYPALYRPHDSSWQNTIRHNLSFNKCFRKTSRLDVDPVLQSNKGKGGYWTIDPAYMPLFRNGQWQRVSDLEPETSQQITGLLRVRGGVPRRHAPSPPAALMAMEMTTAHDAKNQTMHTPTNACDNETTANPQSHRSTTPVIISPPHTPDASTPSLMHQCPTTPLHTKKTMPSGRDSTAESLLRIGSLLN